MAASEVEYGCRGLSAHIDIVKKERNMAMFKQKMTTAMICNPLNWYGRLYSKMETIPVPIL